jgi:hypothetical protein
MGSALSLKQGRPGRSRAAVPVSETGGYAAGEEKEPGFRTLTKNTAHQQTTSIVALGI